MQGESILKTSLIIPSYNPAIKLARTLDALIPHQKFIHELIVVTDRKNYSNETITLIGKYEGYFNMKVIPQEISGRGRSRNTGAEASIGDLLIFLDDDMLAEDNLIEKHIQYYIDNPNCIVSGNGFRNPDEANYDFGKFLIKTEQSWKKNNNGTVETSLKNYSFTASNMSIPKQIFQRLNGFDTRFSDGEDFDLGVRAIKAGIRVIYDINLLAWHNDWPDVKSYSTRHTEYIKAKNEIVKIHPDYANLFPRMFHINHSKVKRFIASVLNAPVIWFVASGNPIFANLPLNAKFVLYNFALGINSVATNG